MIVAAVLVHPAVTVPLGAAALAGLWWMWVTLGGSDVPVSRRRLRRLTTMLLLIAVPLMIAALSFIDRTAQPRQFVMAWTLVLVLMLLVILGASLDALNSLRLHRNDLERDVAEAAKRLGEELRKRRNSGGREDDKT